MPEPRVAASALDHTTSANEVRESLARAGGAPCLADWQNLVGQSCEFLDDGGRVNKLGRLRLGEYRWVRSSRAGSERVCRQNSFSFNCLPLPWVRSRPQPAPEPGFGLAPSRPPNLELGVEGEPRWVVHEHEEGEPSRLLTVPSYCKAWRCRTCDWRYNHWGP